MNISVFWGMMPCSMLKFDVLEQPVTSIIMLVSFLACTLALKFGGDVFLQNIG
jgi:hypothetical protein